LKGFEISLLSFLGLRFREALHTATIGLNL